MLPESRGRMLPGTSTRVVSPGVGFDEVFTASSIVAPLMVAAMEIGECSHRLSDERPGIGSLGSPRISYSGIRDQPETEQQYLRQVQLALNPSSETKPPQALWLELRGETESQLPAFDLGCY